MPKKILIILGHPRIKSLCGSLAFTYAEGAKENNHEIRRINLSDLKFDPIFHQYEKGQVTEGDIICAREDIRWAEHIVFVYPTWWGSMPTLMKGFIERTFVPGFALNYRKNSLLVDKLLKGKSARLIVTMDSPKWYYRWIVGAPGHKEMKKCVLEFCGIKPVKITSVGPTRNMSETILNKAIVKINKLGQKAK